MSIHSEDISVPWGQAPDPLDHQYGKWRMSVFQDMQESLDTSKLYFLYDPVADDNCITTGGRKAMTCLAVFDTHRKCFVAEIPIRVQGRVKMLFALPTPGPQGGTSFVVTSQSEDYGQYVLHVWRFDLAADGTSALGDPRSLLTTPLKMDNDEFICSMRDDVPELVVLCGPQMDITRVDATAASPREPVQRFSVQGAELSHFYDGFLSRGSVYFVSASPDGHLDYSRVHTLSLQTQQITTNYCHADPQRGMPSARKQAALDATAGFLLLAGGELEYGGQVQRLSDYWVLDLASFKWNQVQAQMSTPLIEPRLTTTASGNMLVWGDSDDALPGMAPGSTHVRILRVTGLRGFHPPSYGASGAQPAPYSSPPAYDTLGGGSGGGHQAPYPNAYGAGAGGGGGYKTPYANTTPR